MSSNWINLGTRPVKKPRPAEFPDISALMKEPTRLERDPDAVDVLLVNPPSPDGGIWIRSQHRVGRRSRENMIWPQVSLATMAACLHPDYRVEVVDAIATRMSWPEFEKLLAKKRPKYYLTQVTAPTLTNDMYGVFLAKSMGAKTIAFGTHVTPNTLNTMTDYPALDFMLRGEPELTLRELVDALEGKTGKCVYGRPDAENRSHSRACLRRKRSPRGELSSIKGLAWRQTGEIKVSPDRNFMPDLNELPSTDAPFATAG